MREGITCSTTITDDTEEEFGGKNKVKKLNIYYASPFSSSSINSTLSILKNWLPCPDYIHCYD